MTSCTLRYIYIYIQLKKARTGKDQDKDKDEDLKSVLKDSLRTRINITEANSYRPTAYRLQTIVCVWPIKVVENDSAVAVESVSLYVTI